jgi:peptidoglycan/xylan/chitin deacetylase (PgdA/CDA1 family)
MRINLLLTVDVDNDGTTGGWDRNEPTWDGVARVWDLRELFRQRDIRATWFVRADNQLDELFGDPAYLLQSHKDLWQKLRDDGDEIAWHPHIYHREPDSNRYAADYDEQRGADKLRAVHRRLCAQGYRFESVRIGEAFHGNALMQTLDELGLRVDSTAIPGRVRSDATRRMDWGPTPNYPFHPSRSDFRVPAADSLRILEVPMTAILVMAPYDPKPLPRYANLSYHAPIFAEAMDRHLRAVASQKAEESFLTLIVHPDEVIPRREASPLYAYSLDEVKRNLDSLFVRLSQLGFRVRYLTTAQVPACFGVET